MHEWDRRVAVENLHGREREMVECYCRNPDPTYLAVARSLGLKEQTVKNLMSGVLKRLDIGQVGHLCYLLGRKDQREEDW